MYGEIAEVVVFSPNRGCAVDAHCGKYTVGYGAGRDSRPEKLCSFAGIAPASR